MNDDQRQVLTDLFEAARSDDISSCKVAVANGADINFAKYRAGSICATESWRLRLGGIEWGLQEWVAPEGVHPEAADSLLMIGLKCGRQDLVAWLSSCPNLNGSHENRAGKTAWDIAQEYGRSSWLTNVAEGPTKALAGEGSTGTEEPSSTSRTVHETPAGTKSSRTAGPVGILTEDTTVTTLENKKEIATTKPGWASSINSWDAKTPRDVQPWESPRKARVKDCADGTYSSKSSSPRSLELRPSPRFSPKNPHQIMTEDPRPNSDKGFGSTTDRDGGSSCSTPATLLCPRSPMSPTIGGFMTLPSPSLSNGDEPGGEMGGSAYRLLLQAFEEQAKEVVSLKESLKKVSRAQRNQDEIMKQLSMRLSLVEATETLPS